jgi:peptide/nickel transport system substrate-binding protein
VRDITVVSPSELTMIMDRAYSPTWFLYNDLSQVTPMPGAWDRTASGPSACATTVEDCAAVYSYLNGQSKDMSTYVTSPIWGIVDGPWRLSAFNADGHVTFVPNKSYSGPVKPRLAAFEEVPFTSDAAEYDVLQAGLSSSGIDVGYLPTVDAPARPAGSSPFAPIPRGANPLAAKGYTLAPPYYPWGIGFYTLNFHSTTGNGPVIRQLYFRQALAYLTNQAAVINGPLRGYGAPTVGPVPATPVTPFLSLKGSRGDPYPYNPGKAKSLLAHHGWTVVPNGISTCADPARCGPGIRKGQGLSLTFPYPSGQSWVALEMDQLQSSASLAGIRLNLRPEPFNELPGGNCVVIKSPCSWDAVAGIGWSYAPDYLPTGEALFVCGVPANSGYCDKTNDTLINKTLTSSNLSYLYRWQDYLAAQLPVEWTPNPAWLLKEIADNLRGVLPQSPTLNITPENWYFVK